MTVVRFIVCSFPSWGGLLTTCPEARKWKHGPKRENHLALKARVPELHAAKPAGGAWLPSEQLVGAAAAPYRRSFTFRGF